MNVFRHFRDEIVAELNAVVQAGALPADLDFSRVSCEPPRDSGHGDMATNAAMVLSKAAGTRSRDLAEKIAPCLESLDNVETVEVAGPGFINIRISDAFGRRRWHSSLKQAWPMAILIWVGEQRSMSNM